jgi:hypothetical protein
VGFLAFFFVLCKTFSHVCTPATNPLSTSGSPGDKG